MSDLIDRQAAIDALWKALYEYEDKTEKQFQESEDLDVGDWIGHRIFVQNMNDIDRQTILNLPSAEPQERKTGRWIVFPAPDEQHCGLVECPYCQEELIAEPTEYHYCPNCGAKMEVDE